MMEFETLFGDFWFLIFDLMEFWKLPDEIVSYDTYIIFENYSGTMFFAQNT